MRPLCFPSIPVPFCLFPNSQLFRKYAKNCVFTGKCCMCLSSHFFLFPNSQLIPKCAKHCVFTEKMGRETDRRHLLVKRQCFAQFGIRSAACKVMFPKQSLETTRCKNIRERDSRRTKYSIPATRTMLNPRTPKSQCFSVRFTKSDVRGWIFFAIGANALQQVTLTLNFGGEGVVPDRRGSEYFVHLL